MSWIAVADGLPDDAETVLIVSPMSNEPVWLGFWDSGAKQWRYVEGALARGVTHWMRMPDPPVGA